MEEKTHFQLSASVNGGIVEIVITGEISKDDLDALQAEVIAILREKNAKSSLCDVRDLKGPHDITGAYYRVRSIPADVKILPSAVVDLSGNRDFQSFYETTAANVGQSIRFFSDIEAARAWLRNRLAAMGWKENEGSA